MTSRRGTRWWRWLLCAALAAAAAWLWSAGPGRAGVSRAAVANVASAQITRFNFGYSDGLFLSRSAQDRWLGRVGSAGGTLVLLPVDWASIAPHAPAATSDATDPANPAYHWGALDGAVRDAEAEGLTVVLQVAGTGGPAWADGPDRPDGVPAGTWEPSAAAFGAFATAVAERFSGSYSSDGITLPRVSDFQAWGEPNLPTHLNPQWVKVGGQWQAASASVYRGLLNAFYAGVKSVSAGNVVITAGTAPYGDAAGGARVPPVTFDEQLLCLSATLATRSCPDPAHFDVLAHDPYEIGAPTASAPGTDDASLPDMGRLERVLAAAERGHTVLPRGPKPLWATEFDYETDPPNPTGVPIQTAALWLEESMYVLWSQGVDTLIWYGLVDQACQPSCYATVQAGVYDSSGRPKATLDAARFPFVVAVAGTRSGLAWGVAPSTGTVLIQRRTAAGWSTVATVAVQAQQVFYTTVATPASSAFRAVLGAVRSLTWTM